MVLHSFQRSSKHFISPNATDIFRVGIFTDEKTKPEVVACPRPNNQKVIDPELYSEPNNFFSSVLSSTIAASVSKAGYL